MEERDLFSLVADKPKDPATPMIEADAVMILCAGMCFQRGTEVRRLIKDEPSCRWMSKESRLRLWSGQIRQVLKDAREAGVRLRPIVAIRRSRKILHDGLVQCD